MKNIVGEESEHLKWFFNKLNLHDINYVVLRNFKFLPISTGSSDLDILVHKKSLKDFKKIINQFVKKHKLKLVSAIEDKKSPKYCVLGENWGVQIDVFKNSVFFGNREIIPQKHIFDNSENYNGIKVLNKKVGALLSFLKELLNNKFCKKKYIVKLQSHYKNHKIEEDLLSHFSSKFKYCLNKNLHRLDEKYCLELFQLSKEDFQKNKFNNFYIRFKRVFKQPGYTVTFLGPDGSGKSTIINNIKPKLNKAFHNAVYYEHMRPNMFPSLAKLLGKKVNYKEQSLNPHGSSNSGFFGSFFRLSYYIIDYSIGFYIKIFPRKATKSCVWIFDRYYYDYLIDPKRGRIKLPGWIIKLGQLIVPDPDLILCLGTSARTIHKRKPELTFSEIERQIRDLREFSKTHNKAIWIDTGTDIEVSSSQALEAISNMMYERFETFNLENI